MGVGHGARAVVVAQLHVAQQEDALPRHQDVVEEHDGVHLLKAGAEGVVEVRTALVKALAAEELDAGGVAGDGEGEGVLPVVVGQAVAGNGIDGDFVGNGAEGRQDAAAPDDETGVGLLDGGESHFLGQIVRGGRSAAALEVDQGVGEGDVVFPQELVVVEDVLLELGAVLREVVSGASPGGEDGVHEVRRAAHHAATGPGPAGHHLPLAHQVIRGAGNLEG